MVDGAFYCPAMPEALVMASAEHRAGAVDDATYAPGSQARVGLAPGAQSGPDADGYERFACPAQGDHPHVCCPLRPYARRSAGPGAGPPADPPKVCTQRPSPSPPTSGPATARTWPLAARTGLAPTPPTATPSRAPTAI